MEEVSVHRNNGETGDSGKTQEEEEEDIFREREEERWKLESLQNRKNIYRLSTAVICMILLLSALIIILN